MRMLIMLERWKEELTNTKTKWHKWRRPSGKSKEWPRDKEEVWFHPFRFRESAGGLSYPRRRKGFLGIVKYHYQWRKERLRRKNLRARNANGHRRYSSRGFKTQVAELETQTILWRLCWKQQMSRKWMSCHSESTPSCSWGKFIKYS